MTQINLLPWREKARQIRKIRFGLMVLASVIFAVLIAIGIHGHYDELIKTQDARNNFIQTALGSEQGEFTELNKEKQQQMDVQSELDYVFSLREAGYQTVELFEQLARIVPDAVTFSKIVREGNVVTLIGHAKSNMQITQLMENMATKKIFKQPDLTDINAKQNSAGEERTFQVKVALTETIAPPAKSAAAATGAATGTTPTTTSPAGTATTK